MTRYQIVWFAAAPGGPAVTLNEGQADHALVTDAAPEDTELCQLQDMRCLPSVYRARALQLPEVALVLFLAVAYFVDLGRARRRLRKQLYMPLRHVQVLLTVEVCHRLVCVH